MSWQGGSRFPNLNTAAEDLVFDALRYGIENVDVTAAGFVPFAFLTHADGTRDLRRFVAADPAVGLAQARRILAELGAEAISVALAWDGYVTRDGARSEAVFVEAYEIGRPAGVLIAQPYARQAATVSVVGEPILCGEPAPLVPTVSVPAAPDVDAWARQAHDASRSMVEAVNGDVVAFDRDPLTFATALDDFLSSLPTDELERDDWVWLHAELVAYLAEVLTKVHGGRWELAPDSVHYVIAVDGLDGGVHRVDLFGLVHDHLRPVPQRLPRLIELALAAAGR
jgi:hypothetical protein